MQDTLTAATAESVFLLEILKLVGSWGIFSIAHNILAVSLPLPVYLRPYTKWMLLPYSLLLVMFEVIIS
jgi:hypothetical protein